MLGKGVYLWKVYTIDGGDARVLARRLHSMQVQRLDVKVADGAKVHAIAAWEKPGWGENVKAEWVATLRDECARLNWPMEVWGFGFDYGYDAVGEGAILGSQVNRLGLDGAIADPEGVFEGQVNAVGKARDMGSAYHAVCQKPIAIATWALWRNPVTLAPYHNVEWGKALMEWADYGAPMVYWQGQGAKAAVSYLDNCIAQWRSLITKKPLLPAGRAYVGDGGTVDVPGITAFGQRVRELAAATGIVASPIAGESWWNLGSVIKYPDCLAALSALPPYATGVQPYPTAPLAEWAAALTAHARTQGYRGPSLA